MLSFFLAECRPDGPSLRSRLCSCCCHSYRYCCCRPPLLKPVVSPSGDLHERPSLDSSSCDCLLFPFCASLSCLIMAEK